MMNKNESNEAAPNSVLPAVTRLFCEIAGAFQMGLNPESVKQVIVETGISDINASQCMKIAEKLNLFPAMISPGEKELFQLPRPALIMLKDSRCIILGRNDEAKVLIYDPREGRPVALDREDLLESWTGEAIVFTPGISIRRMIQKYNLGWFHKAIVRYKKQLTEVIASSFFLQALGLSVPLFTQVIIDKVVVNRGIATLDVLAFSLVGLGLFQAGLGFLRTYLLAHTTNKLDIILGASLFQHIISLPLSYFENRRVGDTLMRVNALTSVREFLTGTSITSMLDAFFSIVFFAVMFYYSVPLTLIVFLTIPLYFIQNYIATPIYRNRLESVWAAGSENNAFLVEAITGIHTVKSLALEPQFNHRWEQQQGTYVKRNFDSALVTVTTTNTSALIQWLSTLAILWFGGHMVMDGRLTLGQLIAFQMIANQVGTPLQKLAGVWQTTQQAGLSMERLSDILQSKPEPVLRRSGGQKGGVRGEIGLTGISFRYRPEGMDVLSNINMHIPAGSRVGIVGRSGSGKSTITKLIQRLYSPTEGAIVVDGTDLAETEFGWIRRQIGSVLQENYLFEGSIRENIALSRPGASIGEVMCAARAAEAHEFIIDLPEGYDTKVGERGMSLSGGQRQRIALARALLANPHILILDEATSALDYETERKVLKNITAVYRKKTMIMIAHRLSTVRFCERIFVLDHGRLVEQGTHEDLVRKGGYYYKLYMEQEGSL